MIAGSAVGSITVDSTPTSHAPASRMASMRPSRSARTCSAVVGLVCPKRLALGAATGTPAAAIRAMATGCEGSRSPAFSRPAVQTSGILRVARQQHRQRAGPEGFGKTFGSLRPRQGQARARQPHPPHERSPGPSADAAWRQRSSPPPRRPGHWLPARRRSRWEMPPARRRAESQRPPAGQGPLPIDGGGQAKAQSFHPAYSLGSMMPV